MTSRATRRARGCRAAVAVALAVGALTACSASHHEATPAQVAQRFVSALHAHDAAALRRLVSTAGDVAALGAYDALVRGTAAHDVALSLGTVAVAKKQSAVAPLTTRVDAPPFAPFTLRGSVALTHDTKRGWLVAWPPTTFDAALQPAQRYERAITAWPPRAPILGANDAALTTNDAPVVTVGVEGRRVKNRAALVAALTEAGITGAPVTSALATAAQHPDWFVPVVELPEAAYLPIKSIVYPVPGTVFRTRAGRATVTAGLAAHVVGTTGPITAELLRRLGAPYTANATVGRSGLELADERTLAGSPGQALRVVDARGHVVRTLATIAAVPGTPVHTTIDPVLQEHAEVALAAVTQPAALVVIRVSTGAVVASVSHPDTAAFDIALDGRYPPGSTFKIVTTADLLGHGLTGASTVQCPATITIGGRTFHNFEGEARPSLTLEDAFAASCNAAFIGATRSLPGASFATTAAAFGIGTAPHLGVEAFGGSVPAPADAVDQAATSIGQGRVLVSPVAMAASAATVARGHFVAPTLVVGVPGAGAPTAGPPPAVIDGLRTMMAAVVTRGTAATAGLPAGTFAKTGTAEFGDATPPATHAWFVGYRGDLAFAVLVVGGGVGGRVAAPIAAKFLTALTAP